MASRTMNHLLTIAITYYIFSRANAIPVWDPTTVAPLFKSEATPIGELLVTLSVNGSNVNIEIGNDETRLLCNISETISVDNVTYTANVTLAAELDRDFNPQIRYLSFTAIEGSYQLPRTIILTIMDVNDNPPRFLDLPYEASPPENTEVGQVIFADVRVIDPDVTSPAITVAIVHDETIDGIFQLNQTDNSASIVLAQPLDYETRNSYTITLVATDNGGLNQTTTVLVSVVDVQDTPPFFLFDVYRGAVIENQPAGTSAIQVQAEDGDGDRNIKNDITYYIVEGRSDLFQVDEISGVISNTVVIDREDPTVVDVNGVFQLIVQAQELNSSMPQYGNTTANVTVFITVEDINDNSPTFNTTMPYTAFVRSDIPDNSLIYFGGDGYMQVYDNDQTGKSATFSLHTETEDSLRNVFSVSPSQVFSEANVLIRVVNASAIRSLGGTHITLRVIAREIDTTESFSGAATVVLSVEQTEEPTTTPAPVEDDLFKAPDIVVFVVGFLVLLNITTSIVICYMLRGRSRKDKQGLSRHGSKYYIKQCSTNDFTNHGLHNPSTTEMIEVDPEVAVCPRDPGHGLAFNTRGWRDMLTSPRM